MNLDIVGRLKRRNEFSQQLFCVLLPRRTKQIRVDRLDAHRKLHHTSYWRHLGFVSSRKPRCSKWLVYQRVAWDPPTCGRVAFRPVWSWLCKLVSTLVWTVHFFVFFCTGYIRHGRGSIFCDPTQPNPLRKIEAIIIIHSAQWSIKRDRKYWSSIYANIYQS